MFSLSTGDGGGGVFCSCGREILGSRLKSQAHHCLQVGKPDHGAVTSLHTRTPWLIHRPNKQEYRAPNG